MEIDVGFYTSQAVQSNADRLTLPPRAYAPGDLSGVYALSLWTACSARHRMSHSLTLTQAQVLVTALVAG